MPVNNSAVFNPYAIFFHRLCSNGKAVDQFVDREDDRFKIA
jgi:hypothetical protein